MQEEKEEFRFTYSASEQEELKKIRQKYQPQEESKMDRLRRLDAEVTRKGTMASILLGVIGALVMGTGMSFLMSDFGEMLGMSANMALVAGCVTGIIGMIGICFAYPVYRWMVKKEREKIAPEILKLTEELMK